MKVNYYHETDYQKQKVLNEAYLPASKREFTLPSKYTIVCGCSKRCKDVKGDVIYKNDVPCTEICQCARNCSKL